MLTSHPFPVIRWQISDLVLWDEILQDLGDVLEVRLVIFKFNPVDQCCQLVDLLSWTFVVASQILRQLLLGHSCMMSLSFQLVYTCTYKPAGQELQPKSLAEEQERPDQEIPSASHPRRRHPKPSACSVTPNNIWHPWKEADANSGCENPAAGSAAHHKNQASSSPEQDTWLPQRRVEELALASGYNVEDRKNFLLQKEETSTVF